MSTFSWRAIAAFRTLVSMSAMGSETLIYCPPYYQLDLVTPGIRPSLANFRKQTRHISYFRRYPRGLPHTLHRLYFLVEYFGVRLALIIIAVVAMNSSLTF